MSTDDKRQTTRLRFREGQMCFVLPKSFPFADWQTLQDWVVAHAHMIFWVGRGQFDDSKPSDEWFLRAYTWIEASWLAFVSDKNRYQFLLFHDIEAPPAQINVDAFLGDLSWKKAQKIYLKAHAGKIVEGPKTEPFTMPGAEAVMKTVHFTKADPGTHALVPHYTYAFRKDDMDILVRAVFADPGLIRDGLPVLDEFVRGITIHFGDIAE